MLNRGPVSVGTSHLPHEGPFWFHEPTRDNSCKQICILRSEFLWRRWKEDCWHWRRRQQPRSMWSIGDATNTVSGLPDYAIVGATVLSPATFQRVLMIRLVSLGNQEIRSPAVVYDLALNKALAWLPCLSTLHAAVMGSPIADRR